MGRKYFTIEEMLEMIDGPNREKCLRILFENRKRFLAARGSSHNHQAWRGGYLDHIQETMNIAVFLHARLDLARPLPFSLSDVLSVLFLHDLEKPFKYQTLYYNSGVAVRRALWHTKEDRKAFREAKVVEYGIVFSESQKNAMKYVEGEGGDYTNERRVMGELAAFCHLCDVWSARGWHDYPLEENDPWSGARRK